MNIIQLARKHVGNGAAMESSARICLADAVRHYDAGNLKQANLHALRSMAYSIGTMGGDYRKAWRHVFGDAPVRLPKAVDFLDALEADEAAQRVPHYVNAVRDADGVSRPLSRVVRVF